jgi:uncharacterized damage-inducible protein DinB
MEHFMTPELTRQLFDYNHWANQRALEAAAQLTDVQFTKQLGSSFSSIRDTLVHICGAEWIWLERFLGNSPTAIPNDASIQTVAALREHWKPQAEKLLAYVNGITQAELDRVFEYKTLNFGVYKNPLWQSLQHLANHGTYHRGQIATMIRQLGAKPILTDLMHFYRERATTSVSA